MSGRALLALVAALVAASVLVGAARPAAADVEVVSWNTPHRLGPHTAGVAALARSADVIGLQEVTDRDPARLAPPGWGHYRPTRARHNALVWDRAAVERVRCGARRVSDARSGPRVRYLVWCHYRTPDGPLRVGVVHLPAFYESSRRNRAEYRAQEPRVAAWLAAGRHRVLVGDYNGRVPGYRTPTLSRVGSWSRPLRTGPSGQRIDYVGTTRTGSWRIVSAYAGPYRTSDHRPVVATLTRR